MNYCRWSNHCWNPATSWNFLWSPECWTRGLCFGNSQLVVLLLHVAQILNYEMHSKLILIVSLLESQHKLIWVKWIIVYISLWFLKFILFFCSPFPASYRRMGENYERNPGTSGENSKWLYFSMPGTKGVYQYEVQYALVFVEDNTDNV